MRTFLLVNYSLIASQSNLLPRIRFSQLKIDFADCSQETASSRISIGTVSLNPLVNIALAAIFLNGVLPIGKKWVVF